MDVVSTLEAVAKVLREIQFLLGALFGALLSWVVWSRQFRKQHKLSVIQQTAKALGMFYEDATNPDALVEKERQLKAGKTVRDVMMRWETSSALASQTLRVKAVFGDSFEEELRKVTGSFDPRKDATGNEFVANASAFLKTLLDKV